MWQMSRETSDEVDADTGGIDSLYPQGCEEWEQPNIFHKKVL